MTRKFIPGLIGAALVAGCLSAQAMPVGDADPTHNYAVTGLAHKGNYVTDFVQGRLITAAPRAAAFTMANLPDLRELPWRTAVIRLCVSSLQWRHLQFTYIGPTQVVFRRPQNRGELQVARKACTELPARRLNPTDDLSRRITASSIDPQNVGFWRHGRSPV